MLLCVLIQGQRDVKPKTKKIYLCSEYITLVSWIIGTVIGILVICLMGIFSLRNATILVLGVSKPPFLMIPYQSQYQLFTFKLRSVLIGKLKKLLEWTMRFTSNDSLMRIFSIWFLNIKRRWHSMRMQNMPMQFLK